jgi:flavin reductase (DIM6/NTAB) family NADH-FMN oxidoreductase RutF
VFYEPIKAHHSLPHDPFKSCVIPRPIGWISTLGRDGVANLAPYSQFQNLTYDPPYVMFSANQTIEGVRKDSVVNTENTGEFVWNMATWALREAVNVTAQQVPPTVDEFELAGLSKAPSRLVKPYRVAESPVQFECTYHSTLRLPGNPPMGTVDVVIGRVIGVHIQDDCLTQDGKLDVLKIRPIARLGYYDYTSIESIFEMRIPQTDETLLAGLAGDPRRKLPGPKG